MKKLAINILLPVAVLVFILLTFFKGISLSDIKTNFLKIPPVYLLVFVLLTLVGTYIRAYKYHILLSKKLPFIDVFLITLVRNFSVDLLPGRTAALALYAWFTKKRGISLEEGASSFVISIFYDALALVFMLGGMLFFLAPDINRWPIIIIMIFIGTISILLIFFSDTLANFLLRQRRVQRVPKIAAILKEIVVYLNNHQSHSHRLHLFILSLAARMVKYLFVYIIFEGVVNLGIGLHGFALFSFGLAATELSSLSPIQGPGGFGTWELAFLIVFEALKIPAENIKEAGFVIHITTQAWEYAIGLAAMAFLFFSKPKGVGLKTGIKSS